MLPHKSPSHVSKEERAARIRQPHAYGGPAMYSAEALCFEAYAGGDVIIFRPTNKDNINSEFLSYCLNSGKMTRSRCRLGQGSTVMHIYSKFLKTLTVPIPPLSEQKPIASILSDADAKIDALRAHREKLVALKASLIETLLDPGTANA